MIDNKCVHYIQKFPQVTWALPILCENYLKLKKFNNNGKLSVYGSPKIMLNSGRTGTPSMTLKQSLLNVKLFNEKEIPCYYTFSNYMINDDKYITEDVKEVFNHLNTNDKIQNGVICSSDYLTKYIKNNYPKVKLICSMLKSTFESTEDNIKWYLSMLDTYDEITLHVDATEKTINNIPKKFRNRFIIIVNEPCIKNCGHRKNYCSILKNMTINSHPECSISAEDNCILSYEQIEKYISLGYNKYKLVGRGDPLVVHELLGISYKEIYKEIEPSLNKVEINEDIDNAIKELNNQEIEN